MKFPARWGGVTSGSVSNFDATSVGEYGPKRFKID